MAEVTDATNFEVDFRFLKEMKNVLIEEVLRLSRDFADPVVSDADVRKGIFSETDDTRQVRIILPGGLQNVLDYLHLSPDGSTAADVSSADILGTEKTPSDLCFVGFIGDKKDVSQLDESLLREVDITDAAIANELTAVDGMIAYVSGERVKGGNSGNLVVFKNRGVVKNVKMSENHVFAVNYISPRFYRTVRIHSGLLPVGLRSPYFVLQKTLFLQFTLSPEDPVRRRVQIWRACRKDSDVFKVFPPPQDA